MAKVNDFLNSKSMLTPGIAGAVTMLITNTLDQQFELPRPWVGLVLSFLLGSLVFSDMSTVRWQRPILYIFNSLIIFAMAMGANQAGEAAMQPEIQQFDGVAVSRPFFEDWL